MSVESKSNVYTRYDLIKKCKNSQKDGKQLISIAEDKTLRTWDTQSFKKRS